MALLNHLLAFRASVTEAQNLIAAAHQTDAAGTPIWPQADTRTITQAAFLKVYIAWEFFLEQSLVDYLRGEPSAAGNVLTCYAAPTNAEHATKILIGTQKYVDYSNPEIVRKLAGLYLLNGNPYESILNSISGRLFDLKTIRNAAAHFSSTTSAKVDALASRLLGPPRVNVTVYDLLTAIDPSSATGDTIFQSYVNQIDSAAHAIAHA
jgi:hypothetical protein